MKRMIYLTIPALLLISLFYCGNAYSQENLSYQKPPKEILDMLDYERAPSVRIDSRKENMIFFYRDNYRTLEDLNQQEMRLAGIRINPITNIETSVTYTNNIKIKRIGDEKELQVSGLPHNPRISNTQFSPDETLMAFTHTTDKGVELWLLNVADASAKRISEAILNANLGSPYSWLKDNSAFLVRVLPSSRAALLDESMNIPTGPTISESHGKESQNRTYQDLLKNRLDEKNFETLVKSELFIYDLEGNSKKFMKEALYSSESISPDGNYVMITTIERPYSYIVTMSRFPQTSIVYDFSGKKIKTVNEIPLIEISPKGSSSTREGKRSMSWRSDKPATLYFVTALDGGDGDKKVDFRDQVFQWEAPFDKEPISMAKTPQRYSGISWGNETRALIMDSDRDKNNSKTYLFDPSNPNSQPIVIFDRNTEDVYSNPGRVASIRNEYSRMVMQIDNDNVYLVGDGYSKEGQFPFIDELNLKTLKTKRIYQSSYTDKKEDIESIDDIKKGNILVRIQSQTDFPNYYMRNIRKKKNNLIQITNFDNPFLVLSNVHKEVIKYTREDGIELSGTLYLPVGYDMNKKEKVPMLLWAYPKEYKDAAAASQSTHNPNLFTVPSYGSFVYWVTRGYAVLQDAAFPIVGEGDKEPNDTFIEQLIMNAKAAIDAVDALGYIDRTKVAAGGHSYGAFMTANLLTHCDLFACGIARSGAYNRTLTPFGFQNESRNYWDAPDVYTRMSPFMNAHKMKTPLLLIHGEADNNTGTFTMQSERYFQALKGLGAPARLVLLPRESHGYAAKENVLHVLWEQDAFLEKHLKGVK